MKVVQKLWTWQKEESSSKAFALGIFLLRETQTCFELELSAPTIYAIWCNDSADQRAQFVSIQDECTQVHETSIKLLVVVSGKKSPDCKTLQIQFVVYQKFSLLMQKYFVSSSWFIGIVVRHCLHSKSAVNGSVQLSLTMRYRER